MNEREEFTYFTLTVKTSAKQIRRVVCMWSKIENKFVSRRLIQSAPMSFMV